MPTVRCEVREFGAAENREGILVPTMKKAGPSSAVSPSGASQIAMGPVSKPTNVVVKAIAGAVYAAWGPSPVAAAAPAPGEYIAAGSFAIIELDPGDSIAVINADLS